MKIIIDVLLNVLLVLLLGTSLYFLPVSGLVRNFLPDMLWAYALSSLLLIIWERKVNLFWTVILFIFFCLFELLQHNGIVQGTGDLMDVFCYLLASVVALIMNNYLKRKLYLS